MPHGLRRHLAGGLIATIAALSGCAQPPVPQDQFYRVQPEWPRTAQATPQIAGVLEIDRLSADGLTAGRNIVYVSDTAPHMLAAYNYHFWIEPPTVMLRDQLVGFLRAAGIARIIITPEMRGTPDYIVTGKIHRLERIVGSAPAAVVELSLSVRRSADGRVVMVKSYREQAPVEGESVGDAVIALDRGLQRILYAFAADLAQI